ncbi:MAG: arginine--tRNA ligase, partial [Acidimicrobiia bacterium]|nr:arginine--tRNA ligase [Acidimicrobiia bacterium]
MIRDDLADALRATLARVGVDAPDVIHLEQPARREHGDWSSNVSLVTAKKAGRNPRELATEIAKILNDELPPHVASVEVAGPGFVNFRL